MAAATTPFARGYWRIELTAVLCLALVAVVCVDGNRYAYLKFPATSELELVSALGYPVLFVAC